MGVRSCLAVPRDSSDDEARVAGQEYVGSETPALERARLEILDEYVALVEQLKRELLTLGLA